MDFKLPSNEEVIEELTKDIDKSCIIEPTYSNGSQNTVTSDCNSEPERIQEKNTVSDNETLDSEIIINNNALLEDEFFIDDLGLKDRDENLTEEQKQDLKRKAESLKLEGNQFFKEGNYYEASVAFTKGLKTCPLIYQKNRAILFANRAAARARLNKDLAITDCTKAIELDPIYVKAYLRRARFYEESDKFDEALADYQQVLTIDPHHAVSICEVKKLESIIHEKNEKLKAEMLGQLKDLGNAILRPFGLSTDNFQMQKDESTGNYSINFQNSTKKNG